MRLPNADVGVPRVERRCEDRAAAERSPRAIHMLRSQLLRGDDGERGEREAGKPRLVVGDPFGRQDHRLEGDRERDQRRRRGRAVHVRGDRSW